MIGLSSTKAEGIGCHMGVDRFFFYLSDTSNLGTFYIGISPLAGTFYVSISPPGVTGIKFLDMHEGTDYYVAYYLV
jgi:hypothetical protein